MASESLTVTAGKPGLISLVGRATDLDAGASVRFRQLGGGVIDCFVTTPFEVIASRRIEGELSRDGAVVAADNVLNALRLESRDIGAPRDPSWPGALPPAEGYQLLDTLPVTDVRQLADEGQKLARQFSGPLGPPSSLMNQTVITVEGGGEKVEIPMRMIFTCTSLRLIPGFSAGMDIPRHLRVAAAGRWVRLDAPFGSVYYSRGLGGVLPI
ncbi:hypothetical protein C3B44_09320 [Corynebacterium yudongzhengii]|uniref:Uncharacterized protein n=1 Tax=Corynebacterium yudongzhengii TaxID=2080740 RepID=A0A2U1T959_9CORY|nr:hypothetical protein [Corynebacterium yudongzhengii]AWB82526.1 hypothetical protein C3B44_09320 [Corynebacterium yudongzhengii]PWC02418.1 hypothetical protein DF222_01950 [Corynebacterium yudongzhengii]